MRRRHPRRSSRPHRAGTLLLLVAAGLVLAAGLATAVALARLPDPDSLFSRRVVQSTKIYDRTGKVLLFEFHGEEKRTVVPLDGIPEVVRQATIAIEDQNFYRHPGIDLRGISRALITDLLRGEFRQGGSTITQQLVKNALVGHERTITRKIQEALLAMALEARLEKDRILELYLNQIPYGQNAYGIEAAAQTYFGKPAKELSAAESALLAALPKAPSYYSPYGDHRDELLARKDHILSRMADLEFLSADEAQAAKSEPLEFLPAQKGMRAPHFTTYVRDYLVKRYGEEVVEEGGLTVRTALDWELQEAAERIVREGAARNEDLIDSANMALVTLDPKTGEILAMVGSAGWLSDGLAEPVPEGCTPGVNCRLDPYVNAALRPRQPGSAFKPFVYATAFQKGFEPETVVLDVPTEFNPGCTPEGRPRPGSGVKPEDCYHPQNYDETFRGPVSLAQALAQSLNVPSVKVLYLAGIEDSIRTAENFGISTLLDRSRFGLSLVLGGAEVKLLELVSAMGGFAAEGVWHPPLAILKVETQDGRVLEEARSNPRQVLDPDIARMVSDVLSDDEARVPVFRPRSSLSIEGHDVAAKTGTTQDFRDAWTVGYTPSIAAGVWAGNSDNTPMRQKVGSGVMAAAPAWHEFMAFALSRRPPEGFTPPVRRDVQKPALQGIWQGEAVVSIDTVSGKRATEHTPPETRENVAFGQPKTILHWIDRADPAGPSPQDPARDPQYQNWSAALDQWLAKTVFLGRPLSAIPQELDDVHTPENQPKLRVEATSDANGEVRLRVFLEAKFALREIAVLDEEQVLESRQSPSSSEEFLIGADAIRPDQQGLEVRAYDAVGNIGSTLVPIPEVTNEIIE